MHHVGLHSGQVGTEVSRHLGVVPVAVVVPQRPRRGHHPADRQTGVVHLVPPLAGGPLLAEPPGVHAHLVIAGAHSVGQALRLKGAPADEVRRVVGRDDDDLRAQSSTAMRGSRWIIPVSSTPLNTLKAA